ncbi:hypothetical protein DMJ37_23910 [Vibrio parahaemolyticus]|nr:hypothetical protein [Vibrio parahaemolyticus]OXD02001.1 hypothetical protein CA166_23945 [Vibrio parahaemolyticus]TOE89392.1 hypothetical protein CGJ32_22310 [Vibrio parahaemolyticus]TOI04667.1 hypothetical protein CGI67_24405 [Vibrio parahaemolyticus]
MDWDVLNGVTGVISAICSVLGLGYFGRKYRYDTETSQRILSVPKFMAFLLSSAGWSLLCLCGLWVLEPFGSHIDDREYLTFYGVVLAYPSLMIFMFGLSVLEEQRT